MRIVANCVFCKVTYCIIKFWILLHGVNDVNEGLFFNENIDIFVEVESVISVTPLLLFAFEGSRTFFH